MTYSCSKNTDKIYNCICDNTLSNAYITQRDGNIVKYTNGLDTLSFVARIMLSQNYTVNHSDCGKCLPCDSKCISYTILSNDSIELAFIASYLPMSGHNQVFCIYNNSLSNEYGICSKFNLNTSSLDSETDIPSNVWEVLDDNIFNHKWDNILYHQNDIENKSAVQSMTITEGVGISKIEFECGDIWTLIE